MKDEGQGAVTVLGLLILALMVVGLAVDTTRAIVVRRDLQAACDAGALAGASMVDQALLRSSGGRLRELDRRDAEVEAIRVFEIQAPTGARASARADATSISVVSGAEVRLTLLALAGLSTIDVPAHCRATSR